MYDDDTKAWLSFEDIYKKKRSYFCYDNWKRGFSVTIIFCYWYTLAKDVNPKMVLENNNWEINNYITEKQ